MISDYLKDFVTVSQSQNMFMNTCNVLEHHIRNSPKLSLITLKKLCPHYS